jgi:hypothetical protein
MSTRLWPWALGIALVPGAAGAQDLADRVATVGTGAARVTYPLREDAEVCDQGVRVGERRMMWRRRGRSDVASNCTTGSVEIELVVRDGVVRDVEILEPRDLPTPGAVDLGAATASEAARYLLALARGSETQPGVEQAVFPAMLADVDGLWRDLLELARDRTTRQSVRRGALFWLGQEAGEAATAGIAAVAADEQEEQGVRDAAIFALSQRPADQGVPALMELARSAREAETRKGAMFWLAQSEDERVLAFFEEILLRRQPC